MGYMIVMGLCGGCGTPFGFNPRYVPSLNNIPFCPFCIQEANKIRAEKGLPPHVPHPEAYDPEPA